MLVLLGAQACAPISKWQRLASGCEASRAGPAPRAQACARAERMDDRRAQQLPRRLRWQRQAWRLQQWWQRRLRRGPPMLRGAAWLCAAALLLTTLALYASTAHQPKKGTCTPSAVDLQLIQQVF